MLTAETAMCPLALPAMATHGIAGVNVPTKRTIRVEPCLRPMEVMQ